MNTEIFLLITKRCLDGCRRPSVIQFWTESAPFYFDNTANEEFKWPFTFIAVSIVKVKQPSAPIAGFLSKVRTHLYCNVTLISRCRDGHKGVITSRAEVQAQ